MRHTGVKEKSARLIDDPERLIWKDSSGKTHLERLILSEPPGTTDWNDPCGQGVGAMDRSNQAGVIEAARLSQPKNLAGK
jgi:hypothetical protein